MKHATTITCELLATVCLFNAARIEYWNYQIGGFLPATEMNAHGGITKWRRASNSTTERAMKYRFIRSQENRTDGDISEEQLNEFRPTADQQEEIEKNIRWNGINNSLLDAVITGQLNYILAPIALLLSIRVLMIAKNHRYRFCGVSTAVVAGTCIFLMFYRAYFSSLGW